MAELLYDIQITEARINEMGEILEEFETDLPHHAKIQSDFRQSFMDCQIKETFPKIIREKINSIRMTVFKSADRKTIARVHVKMNQGVRLNAAIREAVFNELDIQMADGFGESMDRSQIPDTPGYCYVL